MHLFYFAGASLFNLSNPIRGNLQLYLFKPFLRRYILDSSKQKAFADANFKVDENLR